MKKLRLEQPPPGFGGIAVLVNAEEDAETSDGYCVLVMYPGAVKRAKEIRRAVNFHDPLVAALTPFRSTEMGQFLIGAIDDRPELVSDRILEARARLERLINAIDVILKGIELMEERDNG